MDIFKLFFMSKFKLLYSDEKLKPFIEVYYLELFFRRLD